MTLILPEQPGVASHSVTPGESDLVAVEEVRIYSLRDASDASMDALWAILIPNISAACGLYAGRQFTKEDDATHWFATPAGCADTLQTIVLSPQELRVPSQVEVGGYVTTDYALGPQNSYGTYRTITVRAAALTTVAITGDWGMASVPRAAHQACLVGIDFYYQNASGHTQESLGSHSFSQSVGASGLPEAARQLLDLFRGVSVL